MFIAVDALMPYPQLYDTVKVVFNSKAERKHRITPPNWDISMFDGVKEREGVLARSIDGSKIIIVFDNGLTWETNVKYVKSLECFASNN